jgi:hypothetical protein
MATINDIVLQVADNVNKSFDEMFKARIKDLIIIGISKYAKQSIVNNGIGDEFISTQEIELEKVKELEVCDGEDKGCYILRSKNKILNPIYTLGSEPFTNVSTYNGQIVAIHTSKVAKKHQKFARYTHSVLMYDYKQGHLILYNNLNIGNIFVDGVYPVSLPLAGTNCETPDCFTTDTEIPLNGNYIDAIKQDIYKELGITSKVSDVEVPITEPTKNS